MSGDEPAGSSGTLDEQGNRWWTVDVSRMLPVYRDLYERIFAERLRHAGLGEAGSVRRHRDGDRELIVFGGPDELFRRLRPASVAQERLARGEHGWVTDLDRDWRAAGKLYAAASTELQRRLLTGDPAAGALATCFDAKVALNALGVDSTLPAPDVARTWLTGLVADHLLPDLLDACYLPASGEVAFDGFERESLVLAQATQYGEEIPQDARRRFVQHGLFFRFDALDPARRERVLFGMPDEAVAVARRSARTGAALEAAVAQVGGRAWRRRYHRQWAHQQLASAGPQARGLFDFAGSARDYDEEKRRLNMPFWRALFVFCDGLGIDLRSPAATARGLCDALERQEGNIPLDPLLTGPT